MCTQQDSIQIIHKQNSSYNYKLIIPKEVEEKIRFICQQVWNTEWSGVLFYNYKGTFEDNTLEIICKDIYIMDVGSHTYTEFSMSPNVVSYMTENLELLDCKQALIHSHSTFKVFFSTTDINTLKEEGLERDNFVSLIVNNAGEYVAAITKKVVKKVEEHIEYPYFGKGVRKSINKYKVEEIEWYDLKVIKEGNNFVDIKNRIKEIKDSKPPKVVPYNGTFKGIDNNTTTTNNATNIPTKHTIVQKSLFDDDNIFDSSMSNITSNNNMFDDLEDIPYNKEVVNKIVLQLITGSVLVDNNSKIDKVKWVNSMPKFFSKAFKEDSADYYFKYWAGDFISFLIENNSDDILDIQTKEKVIEMYETVIADILIRELHTLPKNKYINMYIEILGTYC